MHWTIDPALHRRKASQRIQPVSGQEAISSLKGGFALAQIGPALIGRVGRDGRSEDLLEVIDGELEIALGDGHMGMPEGLLNEVNIARPEVLLQGESVTQAVQ